MRIDVNTVADGDIVRCAHCEAELGSLPDHPFAKVLRTVRPSTDAGAGVRVPPAEFTDREVVLRQSFCPACLTLLSTEIVPADEPEYRTWSVVR
jgi:hypothetical protein